MSQEKIEFTLYYKNDEELKKLKKKVEKFKKQFSRSY